MTDREERYDLDQNLAVQVQDWYEESKPCCDILPRIKDVLDKAGFVIVPKEPSEKMIASADALCEYPHGSSTPSYQPDPEILFKAVLETLEKDQE